MKGFLFLLLSLIGFTACQTSTAQTSTNEPPAKFAVHSEIMDAPKTARNVAINNQGVTACYQNCDVQIMLNFCGQCIIERPGQSPDVYAAEVFQIMPGVWTADLGAGQYVNLFTESGTAQMDIAGEFQVLIPASNLPGKE